MYVHIMYIEFNECDNAVDNDCDTETTICVDTACGFDCTCLSGCEMIQGNTNMCQGTEFILCSYIILYLCFSYRYQ